MNTNIRRGDKVKVARIVHDDPTFEDEWIEEMDEYVGKEFVVDSIDPDLKGALFLETDNFARYCFPLSALEKIQ